MNAVTTHMHFPSLVAFSLLVLPASAADWAQFQGPRGDGTSPETGLLHAWPTNGPPIEWRAAIGQGRGAPAVAGGGLGLAWGEERRGGVGARLVAELAPLRRKRLRLFPARGRWKAHPLAERRRERCHQKGC